MILDKFYNGQSKSKYDQNGFDNLVNCDIHSEPGAIKCQLALVLDSSTPNEACISAVAPTGDVYFFSTSSGKTWKRAQSDGTYSLVNTNANGAHSGCRYFGGRIYYSAGTKLGHFNLASTWTDSAHTFTQSSTYRPMEELNLSLFIGNGKYVASVDNALTFSDNVLDLYPQCTVATLSPVGTDLLITTQEGTNVNSSRAFLWDTYSSSWTIEDVIPEAGGNCALTTDNITFVQFGTAGWIYYWTGARMEKFKQIRGITTAWNPYLSTTLAGKSLFATGTKVFSVHRFDKDMPYVICQEYTATTGTIKSLINTGSQLIVSNGTNVNKIDTNYATAVIDTPEISRNEQKQSYQKITVHYDIIGSGGTIGLSTSVDGAAFAAQTVTTDTIKKQAYFDGGLGDVNFMQGRVTLTPSGANNISIKSISID